MPLPDDHVHPFNHFLPMSPEIVMSTSFDRLKSFVRGEMRLLIQTSRLWFFLQPLLRFPSHLIQIGSFERPIFEKSRRTITNNRY